MLSTPAPKVRERIVRSKKWRTPKNGNGYLRASADDQPLRAELFSVHQLERHAKALAGLQQLALRSSPDQLLARLNDNESILQHTHELLTAAVDKAGQMPPAAEWLLDNYYVIDEQIRTTRHHLPASYSHELPQLAQGSQAGLPRVYGIALELISHVDGGVDAMSLSAFIAAYQTVKPLTLGELWAVPIMLRLALLENLRRVAVSLAKAQRDREVAAEWADRMISILEGNPSDLILVLADMARTNPPLSSSAFVTELTHHLHGQGPHFAFARSWLEHRLSEHGFKISQLVQVESQSQAADQASVGNSITSLRMLGAMDWREFVESQSAVEQTLRGDPAGIYGAMDFATRDLYRHAVEEIAKHSACSELEVTSEAIRLCATAPRDDDARATHVGYYLIGESRDKLERNVGVSLGPARVAFRYIERHPLASYLGTILLGSASLLAGMTWWAAHAAVSGWLSIPAIFPAALLAAHVTVGVVNWIVPLVKAPRPLPKMDFKSGIPPEHRTMVVVPTMLCGQAAIERLLENLEIHYVANKDANLHFALLTDFKDAPQPEMPDDEALLEQARNGILALNEKYGQERTDIFYLFHRPRRWNEAEGTWMGYERKRGKLREFNSLVSGGPTSSFSEMVGELSILPRVRHVITLDSDTYLPRDAAREMVGAMAHPLNRPVVNKVLRRVVRGYGILQPRIETSLPSASRSRFSRVHAAESGLDPYTRAVSDVYQDLFAEGSFIGKGIYDVEAFEQTCANFPENRILSHDLIEGCYARSGLLNDIELYEDQPSSYLVDVSRRKRWMRGDWQIASWLFGSAPGADGQAVANTISALSRWKLFDNLRRSATPLSLLALLTLAWLTGDPGVVLSTMLLVIGAAMCVPILASVTDLLRKPLDLPASMHLRSTAEVAFLRLVEATLSLVFLPYEAAISVDAIARTLSRLYWTRRRLLEWTTTHDVEHSARTEPANFWRAMRTAPFIAIVLAAVEATFHPLTALMVAPLLALWALSPLVAWYVSCPIAAPAPKLSPDQQSNLRKLARRTWRYFETFVNQDENWLPPDNFQEHPAPTVASRTSPTNIGVALLANLAAHDFGYVSTHCLLKRTKSTLDSMELLERYRGHFYNWYDTRTLAPLPPHYVSTVDSGNLDGYLLVLQQGLLELMEGEILPRQAIFGIRDTLGLLLDTIRALAEERDSAIDSRLLTEALRNAERADADYRHFPDTLSAAAAMLHQITEFATEIAEVNLSSSEVRWWANAVKQNAIDFRDDIAFIATWITLPPPPEKVWRGDSPNVTRQLVGIRDTLATLESVPTLGDIVNLEHTLLPEVEGVLSGLSDASQAKEWLRQLHMAIKTATQHSAQRLHELEHTAKRCGQLAQMDYVFLYDKSRSLLSIGYNVTDHRLDNGYYDLLASEARLASYLAIAEGQIDKDHWFAMRRILTRSTGAPTLLSWNGSMFEYLMPLLIMPTYSNTLLDQTYKAVVKRQIDYGNQREIPWGVSESGYNALDARLNYHYRGFGVPGLGLKRRLSEDVVVAPYASVMALMVAPEIACRNIERLLAERRHGAYGLYEAIDYTPSRSPRGSNGVTVRSFMVHHQGMSLLSLAYVLLDRPMQRRFERDLGLRATELLLQERIPKAVAPIYPHAAEASAAHALPTEFEQTMRILTDPAGPTPEVHLLSNGRYHVMITAAGAGYSRWKDLAVTRWREDPTRDCWGAFCFVRDLDTAQYWSVGYQPTLKQSKSYEAIFVQAKAEFRRRDDQIETHTEISVSAEDDIELRRITLTNRSERVRTIELTSYAEVVLAPSGQDDAHPAYSNIFVQTEVLQLRQAILCTRRPRAPNERPPWMLHLLTVRGETVGKVTYETDRMKFVGRGRTLVGPAAMDRQARLTNSDGSVLDPVVSIRCVVRLKPGETAQVDLVTGVTQTREAATLLIEKYRDSRLADRVFELAWTHSQVELRHLNASEADAQLYGRLASSVVYATPAARPSGSVIIRNRHSQAGLWGYGISGDLPIVLVRVHDVAMLNLVQKALQAHAYWRTKGLSVDLVIWNEDDSVYRQELHDTIMGLAIASPEAEYLDKPGGVFVRRGEQLTDEDRILLQSVARVALLDDTEPLKKQVERRRRNRSEL